MRALPLLFLLAAAATAPAARADPAPLPPHWASTHPNEEESGYRPPAGLRGIYGHGFTDAFHFAPREYGDRPVCQGDEAAQQAYVAAAGAHLGEFWFYATAQQGILFERSVALDPARPCAQGVRHSYTIHRAFVADGLLQILDLGSDGVARMMYTHGRTAEGSSNILDRLMSRTPLSAGGRLFADRIHGLRVSCRNYGMDYIWSRVCMSRTPGATLGMVVLAESGDDADTQGHLSFEELRPDAALDGRLFELDRDWLAQNRPGVDSIR
jgi:hypothetical protein